MSSVQQGSSSKKVLQGMVIFLGVLCASSAFGLIKQAQIIKHISHENKQYRAYARTAQNLAQKTKPNTLENFQFCDKPDTCMTCRAVTNGNKKILKDYHTALNTLNIDPKALETLRQGPEL